MNLDCTFSVEFRSGIRGRRLLRRKTIGPTAKKLRQPRIARLMALAIRLEELLKSGLARDYAELARLGSVDRSMITKIMALRLLAPDLQERLLSMEGDPGTDPIYLKHIVPATRIVDWREQRRHPIWNRMEAVASRSEA